MMLDLQPIRDSLEAATSWSIGGDGEELCRKAGKYLADLLAEVERLRSAIEEHRKKLTADSLHGLANAELWEVIDE